MEVAVQSRYGSSTIISLSGTFHLSALPLYRVAMTFKSCHGHKMAAGVPFIMSEF